MGAMKAKPMLAVAALMLAWSWVAWAQTPPADSDGPQFTSAGELVLPANYGEWVHLSSGLGMAYGPNGGGERAPSFTNVYANPSSYRSFMKTGKWPDKTMLVLEIRASANEPSLNKAGRFQSELLAVEADVKDEVRFPGTWAFFNFGPTGKRVKPLPSTSSCNTCHANNTAVDQTFVQFYPTLFEVARRMGTLNPSFLRSTVK